MSDAARPRYEVSISETAQRQLAAIKPPYEWLTYSSGVVAAISRHVATWTPRSERGGKVIKWCPTISLHCNTDIYRLKSPLRMGEWRVFFFLLDLDSPPTRRVEEIVEWQSNEQCYDDVTQPHVVRLRTATSHFKATNRLRLMR